MFSKVRGRLKEWWRINFVLPVGTVAAARSRAAFACDFFSRIELSRLRKIVEEAEARKGKDGYVRYGELAAAIVVELDSTRKLDW